MMAAWEQLMPNKFILTGSLGGPAQGAFRKSRFLVSEKL